MKNTIIVHGKPSRQRYENPDIPKPHEANWLPWTAKELGRLGIKTSILAMPKPYHPVYKDWKTVFEREPLTAQTSLVGHSTGAEFILRWLSENPQQEANKVVLVAPWTDADAKYGDFSEFEIDNKLRERIERLTIMTSIDDSDGINARARAITDTVVGSHLLQLSGYGHFMIGNTMKSEEFPRLIEELTIT